MKRILVIDDEPTALEVLRRILEIEGYEVVTATNGQDGLEQFKKTPCDLVITDMVMPIKDGLQTILDLRKVEPHLPVIAVSGGGGSISKERYLAVAGYLDKVMTIAKPFTVEIINDAVGQLLSESEAESASELESENKG